MAAGITVSRETLQFLGGLDISPDHWDALLPIVRGVISSSYRGDLDTVEGRAQEVVNSVFTSVALRVLTNPTGARSISLGDASVTTAGSDDSLIAPLSLTSDERRDLQKLRSRLPSFVAYTTYPKAPT